MKHKHTWILKKAIHALYTVLSLPKRELRKMGIERRTVEHAKNDIRMNRALTNCLIDYHPICDYYADLSEAEKQVISYQVRVHFETHHPKLLERSNT